MDFNTPVFLFIFLPLFLVIYFVLPSRAKPFSLLLFSGVFFIWSDPLLSPYIFGLVLVNYGVLRLLQRDRSENQKRSLLLAIGIGVNLGGLLFFKMISEFSPAIFDWLYLRNFDIPGGVRLLLPKMAHIPIGLSFLTLQLVGMLIDAKKRTIPEGSSYLSTLNYLLMFPKATAGPIAHLRDKTWHIQNRTISITQTADGVRRFLVGFAKKALIADQLALITDQGIFFQAPGRIPFGTAWLVLISFAVQIYIDFSAYSDMAIGLAHALGYDLPENFNFPYLATSMTDFWRRWHMTLSNWFREYVFYPLERQRSSISLLSQPINILIVFLFTGLWHGIRPPFIVWGLLQGAALVLERGRFGAWLKKSPRLMQHIYTLSLIGLGWVFFRSPTIGYGFQFLKTLMGFPSAHAPLPFSVFQPVPRLTWIALGAGLMISFGVHHHMKSWFNKRIDMTDAAILFWGENLFALALFVCGVIVQTGSTYVPFIYGEF